MSASVLLLLWRCSVWDKPIQIEHIMPTMLAHAFIEHNGPEVAAQVANVRADTLK